MSSVILVCLCFAWYAETEQLIWSKMIRQCRSANYHLNTFSSQFLPQTKHLIQKSSATHCLS